MYSLDILVTSSAEGKPKRAADVRTTILKRVPDVNYQLKMASSRRALNEIQTKFGFMPFNIRNMEEEGKARLGVVEPLKNGLLMPYDVLQEKEGSFVAQFLVTVFLMPSGNILKLTNYPFQQELVQSDKTVQDPELKKLLATGLKKKAKK